MKKIKILLLLFAIFATRRTFAQTQIINISTGYDQSTSSPTGTDGLPDDDWEVKSPSSSTFGPTYHNADGMWTNGSCSNWVTPGNGSGTAMLFPGGNYIFRVKFTPYNISGCNASNIVNAKIVFSYTDADDQLNSIKLNSNPTPIYNYPVPGYIDKPGVALTNTFPKTTSYSVNITPSNILNGVNTLDFEVFNYVYPYPGQTTTPVGLNICATIELTYSSTLTAAFTMPSQVCDKLPTTGPSGITATPSTSMNPSISSYAWIITECDQFGIPLPSSPSYWNWGTGYPLAYTFPNTMPGGLTISCGKYYLVKLAVQNPCVPWGETTKIVYVNCLPNISAGADITICNGSCATLTATGPSRNHIYEWYVGSALVGTGKTITDCPTTTTTYCVTATNTTTGCSATDCITVNVENLDPNFTVLGPYTTNSSYMTLSATPNQVTGLPAGFGFMWFIDELNSSMVPVYSVNSGNPSLGSCWWTFPTEVFDGFDGLTYSLNNTCLPTNGQFKYNTNYRITRGVWSTNCPWDQKSYQVIYNRSANGYIIVEDPNAPDMSGFIGQSQSNSSNLDKNDLILYPNPTENTITLEYMLNIETNGKIIITDVSGREVKSLFLSSTTNQLQIDISDLLSGTYFVNLVENGKLSTTKKLMVTK